MYNIVLTDNTDFILATCKTLKQAQERLKDMKKTDKKLQKYYGWNKTQKYEIREVKEK
jgi:hypothetical protein